MTRLLRHARANHKVLAQNNRHQVAARQALVHFASGAIYSFIPKNGCTSLRYSLALANGCIAEPDEFVWIHDNNSTFVATLRDLAIAPFTFVILRCPYARLASSFLDKIVKKRPESWILHRQAGESYDPDMLTFRAFCGLMKRQELRDSNIHWRRQIDLLVYEDYDAWFCLEAFAAAAAKIEERTGLVVHDTRALAKHDTSHFEIDASENFSDCPVHELDAFRRLGSLPAHFALYDDQLAEDVAAIYAADIELYGAKIGTDRLMFS